jgi:hypothetical protein
MTTSPSNTFVDGLYTEGPTSYFIVTASFESGTRQTGIAFNRTHTDVDWKDLVLRAREWAEHTAKDLGPIYSLTIQLHVGTTL